MNPRFLHYVHQVYFKIASVGRIVFKMVKLKPCCVLLAIDIGIFIQGVLCLRGFLRLWKNNSVSRKPCKRRSDLVLNGQMRVPK